MPRLSIKEASEAMMRRALSTLLALLSVAACSGTPDTSATTADNTYHVVTTTSIFADLAEMALGDAATIESIVPAGADVHTFEPSPSDVKKIQFADLIIANGLGLDDWIGSLIEAAGKGEHDMLLLGEGLDQERGWIYLQQSEGRGTVDPHIWLDPKGAALYVQRIADRVSGDAPNLAERITASSADGVKKIEAVDRDLAAAFAAIDPSRRKIVTMHDAFGYFARAYEIEIVGVAVASPGQDPSAQEIRTLIDAIRAAGVTALFSEVQLPSKVLEQIAAETGTTVLQDLYSDALGAPPADSYLGVMRTDADAILGALR
jgi:zinc/manganese transport system substrate-binding protein